MLENAYPYCLVQKEQGDNSGLRQILLYHFKSTKSHLIYMVRVELDHWKKCVDIVVQ